jgi:hypothetical protein
MSCIVPCQYQPRRETSNIHIYSGNTLMDIFIYDGTKYFDYIYE